MKQSTFYILWSVYGFGLGSVMFFMSRGLYGVILFGITLFVIGLLIGIDKYASTLGKSQKHAPLNLP